MAEMWWSEATLQPGSRLAAGGPHRLHQAVETATGRAGRGGGEARTLWRLERNVLLVQAQVVADWDRAGARVVSSRVRRVDDAWDGIVDGDDLAFACFVNPTVAMHTGMPGVRGVRVPINPKDHGALDGWWAAQGVALGFDPQETSVAFSRTLEVRKPGRSFAIVGVELVGTLRVVDSEQFRRGLRRGVGRERAFGCGLMLIRRA